MNVLLIGSGGREHALAWKIKQSPQLGRLFAIPGSAAMKNLADCPAISQDDFEAISEFCGANKIELVVVGPEAPLAKGISDFLSEKGIKVFGPSQKGAMLEASKQFAKEFMYRNSIPTAAFTVLYDAALAREKIKENKRYPVVIKADGLAAGKGVRICANEGAALEAVADFMERRIFGASGSKVVMEEFLTGREASVIALVDGESFFMLPVSRDHKRLRDGDEGPNTGGMGAVCPVELEPAGLELIKKEVLQRFVDGIKKEQIPFCGVLFAGLIFTPGGPKVLEFNCRFGDPETQSIMPLVAGDLLQMLKACADKDLSGRKLEISRKTCVSVVLASGGYPENPEKGKEITGLYKVPAGALVFHAGTVKKDDGYVTGGGRVLSVTATGDSVEEARQKAYAAVEKINFEGMQYRKDIGL
ncbi:MAG: phosphoribosylamine--glycine ligase [Elusimicrobia bacterium CG1_02_56_21]|nr:MAG: phosphoribosylamine--glycine ligase [Elusimicrobia bacterium CG1_02_56_21]